jgi:predicted O-linked N-acetylglucosamine transferase (SPINDLY family)
VEISQLINEGLKLHQAGQWDAAEQIYRQILTRLPGHPEPLHLLGLIAHQRGDSSAAAALIRQAIAAQPSLAVYHYNLATILQAAGHFDQAVGSFRRAIELQPDNLDAWNNLGLALANSGRLEESIAAYRRGLVLGPQYAPLHNNLGKALCETGQVEQALACLARAADLRPDYAPAHSNLLLMLHYRVDDPQRLFAEHQRWAARHAPPPPAPPARPPPAPAPDEPVQNPERPLRIGYLSSDFYNHATAAFIQPLLAHHDRERFTLFCYSAGTRRDHVTDRFRSLCHAWRDLAGASDEQANAILRADHLDILIDLSGHTAGRMTLLAHKPAPVQISYLGYPDTTGMSAVDYRLSDELTDPPGQDQFYTETLIRLPRGFCCFAPPTPAPEVNELPALDRPSITFGSLHGLSKLSPGVLDLWSDVLCAIPSARLLIARDTLAPPAGRRLLDEFRRRGIETCRIELRHHFNRGHLSVYHDIDVALDTFPWSGHTTACEGLWMGVPIVTLRGRTFAGRMVAGVLARVGLEDLIAEDPQQFIQIARDLAGDFDRLGALRRTLRERMTASPLCDAPAFTRDLEAAYRKLWQHHADSAAFGAPLDSAVFSFRAL